VRSLQNRIREEVTVGIFDFGRIHLDADEWQCSGSEGDLADVRRALDRVALVDQDSLGPLLRIHDERPEARVGPLRRRGLDAESCAG